MHLLALDATQETNNTTALKVVKASASGEFDGEHGPKSDPEKRADPHAQKLFVQK